MPHMSPQKLLLGNNGPFRAALIKLKLHEFLQVWTE